MPAAVDLHFAHHHTCDRLLGPHTDAWTLKSSHFVCQLVNLSAKQHCISVASVTPQSLELYSHLAPVVYKQCVLSSSSNPSLMYPSAAMRLPQFVSFQQFDAMSTAVHLEHDHAVVSHTTLHQQPSAPLSLHPTW